MLALLLFGLAGLAVELVLLEHYGTAWKWAPLVLLVVALIATAAVAWRPGRATLAAFRAVMTLCVVTGALGVYLHYRGNVEFEQERDARLRGLALFWAAIRGATPSLAPGALAQLGLLGLALAYRHPAGRAASSPAPPRAAGAGINPGEAR